MHAHLFKFPTRSVHSSENADVLKEISESACMLREEGTVADTQSRYH